MITPFLWTISSSLKDQVQLFTWPPSWIPDPIVWNNYVEVWGKVNFGVYGLNTLKIALTATISQVITSSLAGYAFARLRFPGKTFFFILILATMMIPFHVTLIPSFIILRSMRLMDTHLGVILPSLASPFGIFLMRQFFLSFPQELEDAAKLDGCNPFSFYWYILLPNSKPILATLGVLAFQNIWNDFLWPLVVLSTESKRTLAVGLSYLVGQYQTRWEIMAAGSIMTVLPIIILFFVLQRYFIQSVKLSGIKG
ncbi:carbohydrate ABC transporter permease [bacterium]|nr:MAG: carbohydrate ABC transporter permease [bacterium]